MSIYNLARYQLGWTESFRGTGVFYCITLGQQPGSMADDAADPLDEAQQAMGRPASEDTPKPAACSS